MVPEEIQDHVLQAVVADADCRSNVSQQAVVLLHEVEKTFHSATLRGGEFVVHNCREPASWLMSGLVYGSYKRQPQLCAGALY